MAHKRTQITAAVKASLEAGAGMPTVFVGRIYPAWIETIPFVNVVIGDELADPEDPPAGAGAEQIRETEVRIEVWEASEGDVDTAADVIALIVEQQLGSDPTLGGVVDRFRYQRSAEPERSPELETAVIARELTYLSTYTVDPADPQ